MYAECWATARVRIARRPGAVVYELTLGERDVESVTLERRGHTLAVTVDLSGAQRPLRRAIPLPVDMPRVEPIYRIDRIDEQVLRIEFSFPKGLCDGRLPEYAGWMSPGAAEPEEPGEPEPCKRARETMRDAIAAVERRTPELKAVN